MAQRLVCSACGYEVNSSDYVTVNNEYKTTFEMGDKEFLKVYVNSRVEIKNPIERVSNDYDYQEKISVELYACPKCNAIKLVTDVLK